MVWGLVSFPSPPSFVLIHAHRIPTCCKQLSIIAVLSSQMHSLLFGGWQLTWCECDLNSFCISCPFHEETGSKELVRSSAGKGWGAFCEKHEASIPRMLSHLFGEAAGLCCWGDSCFASAGNWTLLTCTFLPAEGSSTSSATGRICHASEGSFSDVSPHTSVSGHAAGIGAGALAWNTSLGWEFLCGWNFPCTYPLPYASQW